MVRQAASGVGILFVVALVVGCSQAGSAPTSKVTGTITHKGTPLAGVSVTFTPDEGRPGTGTTDAQGRYSITTFQLNDGAVPGRHRVTVAPGGETPMPQSPQEAAQGPAAPFASKYMQLDKTDLTAQVESGKSNQFDFDLTD